MVDSLLTDLKEFIQWKDSEQDLWNHIYNKSNKMLFEGWNKTKPKNEFQRRQFYIKNVLYLFELVRWNIERKSLTERLVNFVKLNKIKTAFDFGCGIGTDGLELIKKCDCQVTFCEINLQCLSFLVFRLKRHNLNEKAKITQQFIHKNYDLLICLDVLEHLQSPVDLFISMSSWFKFVVVTFGGDFDNIPMHLNENKLELEKFNDLLKSNYEKIDTDIYRRIK